jgi:hypothetical protein
LPLSPECRQKKSFNFTDAFAAERESIRTQLRERGVDEDDVDKIMQVLPYAGLHGERERAATTDDEERPPKQPRTDKHGEHAYPTDRSKPAPSARDQSAGTSSSKQNQPVGDLSNLLKATDETTLTTIIELLDAGQAVPKKCHHSQQKAGKADVAMTDADGTDGGYHNG